MSSSQFSVVTFIFYVLQFVYADSQTPFATVFHGTGLAGSVVDATGCLITYELQCTDYTACALSSTITKTVTQNPSSFVASFFTTDTASGNDVTGYAAQNCKLHGSSSAYCTDYASVDVSSSYSTTVSTFHVPSSSMNFGQVPITAGPSAALASVTSCMSSQFEIAGSSSSSSTGSTATSSATIAATPGFQASGASNSNHTDNSTSGPGLSAGAKAGIGAAIGIGAALILAIGASVLLRRRKSKARAAAIVPAPDYDDVIAEKRRENPYLSTLTHEMAVETALPKELRSTSPSPPKKMEVGYSTYELSGNDDGVFEMPDRSFSRQ